jgi:benzodiazapine receptor
MSASSVIALVVFLGVNMAAAMSGALFRPGAWHRWLKKPSWNPPNWLFAPAWTVLYLMIAVAGWRVFEARGWDAWPALAVYAVSLCLNAAWSGLFFGLKRPDVAFFELLALWASIALMIFMFAPIDALAAGLLVPYLCWVTFAGALNFAIWRLNTGRTYSPDAA